MATKLEGGAVERLAPMFAVCLFCAYALLIVWHDAPPYLGDFQVWIYSGVLLSRHFLGLPDAVHSLKKFPVPNSVLTLALGLLSTVFPWKVAAKLYLLFHLAIAYFSIRSLARAAGTPLWIWYLAPGVCFFGLGFWYGLFAFQLGIALLFFFVAKVWQDDAGARETWVGPQLLLLLLFFTHMVPFTFACLLLLLKAWQRRQPHLLRLLILPSLLLVWYCIGRILTGNQDSSAVPAESFQVFSIHSLLYKLNTLAKSFGFVNPHTTDLKHSIALQVLGYGIFLLLFAFNLAGCGASLALCWKNFSSRVRSSRAEPVWQAVIVSLAVYLLVPESLFGISDPGARIFQTAIATALFFCVAHSSISRYLWRIAATTGMVLSVAGVLLFAKVAWTIPSTTSRSLPVPIEALAKVPYAYTAGFHQYLDRRDYGLPVFPTGLFLGKH